MIMACFAAALYSLHSNNLRQNAQRNLEMAVYDLERGLADRTKLLTALAEAYVHDTELLDALKAKDRQRLLDIGEPKFKQIYQQHNITHFYFHDTEGVNILRVHQPRRYGDAIYRETMHQAITTGTTASGIELGPLGTFTLRVVMPVNDDTGNTVGYLELGQEIQEILEDICRDRQLELAITIHKSNLKRTDWEQGQRLMNRTADWDRFRHDILTYSSLEEFPLWDILLDREPTHNLTDIDAVEVDDAFYDHHHRHIKTSTLEHVGEQWWYSMTRPVTDASGDIVGDLFVFDDATAVMARMVRVMLLWSGVVLGALLLLTGFLYFALRNVDRSILSREEELCQKNEALADYLNQEKETRQDLESVMGRLEAAATTDELTGLPNRVMFMNILRDTLAQSREDGNQFAVLFMDFDRFKVVNDSLGHEVGDALLCDIAKRIRKSLCDDDVVSRFGGDEFVVLLKDLASWFEAELMGRALLDVLAAPHRLDDYLIVTTASIGLVNNEHDYDDPNELIRDADIAMYQAKGSGKAKVVIFDKEMQATAMERMRLEADLQLALSAGNQFSLAYQPIIDLESGRLTGFEALLRWERPGQGPVSPADFIPVAEDTGMIVEIGRWVMETAAQQIAIWNKDLCLLENLSVNVNVSKQQLLAPNFVSDMLACKERFNLSDEELHLEITESTIANDREDVIPLLRQLQENGFKIAMDDFGTGVSSLSALHEYPIDVLKIDQAFIRVLDRDRSLLAVVTSITNMAENLGIKTVAEGIETQYVVGALQSINCTWGQGYLFAKPLKPEDAERYIRMNNLTGVKVA